MAWRRASGGGTAAASWAGVGAWPGVMAGRVADGTFPYGTERYGTERYGTEGYGTGRCGTEGYGTEGYGAGRRACQALCRAVCRVSMTWTRAALEASVPRSASNRTKPWIVPWYRTETTGTSASRRRAA